ncbi:spherulation-specific family 4 protein [Phytohabitans suffuscus]|uniref:Uncharacterized protein n=1 Tax=Phytohabitans suffuscus TaxID=624315 RepID=A0A6F8YNL2_9ACTN|nr:spherulation-specific family 4 protein [Phytohabitans suffuscus]BCB87561.1 hypothetical protein Psuf_048740 [Phytohabitans suffuscus]
MDRLVKIDLEYGERPLADVLDAVRRRAAQPHGGIFLDRAPSDLAGLGGVALTVRVARRAGFELVVLNPGQPVDPAYRALGTAICVFDGDWAEYQRWSGEGAAPGDGHLVHGVPPAQTQTARKMMEWRGAGFGVVAETRTW